MRGTGIALAAISSVCLLFIGDGCISWITSAFSRRDGYSAVSAQEEIEMEEKVPLTGKPSDGVGSNVVDGHPAKAPTNGQMVNGN